MAELYIRVIDKINADFYLNQQCTKAGDVIVACPDDWPWGNLELSSPDYRILSIPEMSLSEARALVVPEVEIDPNNPSKTRQARQFKLDLASLGASFPLFRAHITVSERNTMILRLPNAAVINRVLPNVVDIRAAKVTKPPIPDPLVLGLSRSIIGPASKHKGPK